jgi:hypothetical protein
MPVANGHCHRADSRNGIDDYSHILSIARSLAKALLEPEEPNCCACAADASNNEAIAVFMVNDSEFGPARSVWFEFQQPATFYRPAIRNPSGQHGSGTPSRAVPTPVGDRSSTQIDADGRIVGTKDAKLRPSRQGTSVEPSGAAYD